MTTTLIVGATGMTGNRLVEQLLDAKHKVRVIVRSPHKFSVETLNDPNMTVIDAKVLDLSDEEMAVQVKGCNAVVSCLGHSLDFSGMFRNPRRLCTAATRRLCRAIEMNNPCEPIKFILMNTVGVQNPDCSEKRKWFELGFLSLLRHAVPPHRDNETAAEHLYQNVGKNNAHLQWCIVRPDSLINAEVSAYEIEESPTTGIFTGRPTTRSNVAHFMSKLIENAEIWDTWKFRMPVIMNSIERHQPTSGISG